MFSHAEYETLHEGAGLLNRSARGRLQLNGADRRTYLHGLLTNDILALATGAGCYAALLTAQGRMISDMRVSELVDRTLVDLPAATADAVRQHFEDFIFSEDVTVTDLRSTHVQLGLIGPRAAEILAEVLTASEDTADRDNRLQQLTAIPLDHNVEWRFVNVPVVVISSDDYGRRGFELLVDATVAGSLERALYDAGARDVSPATAEVTRIESGRPEFGPDMDAHTIPLEAGIEGRAISLTKGCYVGQEIIIRVLHRGHGRIARRLMGLRAGADVSLTVGDPLMAGDEEAGKVTSAAFSPRLKQTIGLGYVHRNYAEPGSTLATRNGGPVTVVTTLFGQPAAE